MAGNPSAGHRVDIGMRLELTSEAVDVLERKGGVMTIDYIRPTG